MEWLIFALIGQLIISFTAAFAKIIRTKIVKSTLVYLVYTGFISFFAVLLLIPIVGFEFPSNNVLLYVFFTSLPFMIGSYFIVKAFSIEDISRISIFLQLQPLFVLILATIFLNEILFLNQYLGFSIIIIGSLIASRRSGALKAQSKKAFRYLIATNFFWAIYITMAKFTYSIYGFWNTFILVRAFFLIFSLIILFYLILKQNFDFKKVLTKGTALIGLNESIVVVAVGFSQFALSIGPASLVSVTKGTAPLFILIIAYILSKKFPNLLQEELNKKVIMQKVLAIIFVLAGLLILYL